MAHHLGREEFQTPQGLPESLALLFEAILPRLAARRHRPLVLLRRFTDVTNDMLTSQLPASCSRNLMNLLAWFENRIQDILNRVDVDTQNLIDQFCHGVMVLRLVKNQGAPCPSRSQMVP